MGLMSDIFIAANKDKMEKAYHDMMNDPRLIAATNNFDASRDALDRAMGNPILTPSQRRIMYGMAELYGLSEDNKKFFNSSEGRELFIKNIMDASNTTESMAAYIFKQSIDYGKIHEELVEHKLKNKLNVITETKKVEERVKEKTPEEIKKTKDSNIITVITLIITIPITIIFELSALQFLGLIIATGIVIGFGWGIIRGFKKNNKSTVEKPKTIKNKRIKNRL